MKRATLYAAALAAVLLWPPALPAQTPEAASAACRIDCGSCVLVDTDGCGNYRLLTAAHVVGRNRTATVYLDGKPHEARVVDRIDNHGLCRDWAVLDLASERDLPVVPVAKTAPAEGAPVWTAGYPANGLQKRKQVVHTGRLTSTGGALVADFAVRGGASGSPLMTADGLVGIIGHAGHGNSYATNILAPTTGQPTPTGIVPTGLLGRRRPGSGCENGDCTPTPDEPIETPAITRSAQRLVEIEKGVAANGEGINQLGAMLAEHEARRQAAVDAEAARLAAENAADTVEREDATDYTLPGLALVGVLFAVGAVVASLRSGKEAVVGHFQTVLTE